MITEIRTLLIEDNAAIAHLIERILANVPGRRFEISWVTSLAAALQMFASRNWDVVVLDLSLPDSNGLDTFRRVRAASAEAPIVILTGDEDESTALTAVGEGAEDFLTKTLWQPESLARTLLFAIERYRNRSAHARSKPGAIYAFIGVKGGVGATTAALNVAGALASADKICIAIELRADRGSFAVHLAHKPAKNLSAVRDMPSAGITRTFLEPLLVNACRNLKVLHGPQQPGEFGDIPAEVAAAVVETASLCADYVVLDLPSHAGAMTQVGASKAAFTIVVMDRDPVTAEMARGTLPLLRSWGIGDSRMSGLVMNRSALPDGIPTDDLKRALGCPLIGVVPLDNARTPCYERGLPATIRRPDAFAAASLIEVARKLPGAAVALS